MTIHPPKLVARTLACAVATAGLALSLAGCDESKGDAEPKAERATPATAPATTPPAPSRPTQPAQAPPGIPPLVASPAKIDFGIVEPGSKLAADVTLLNTSTRPVRILKAQPSCTCTTVDMTNVVIPPRATVQMPIAMTTNRAVGKKIARIQLMVEGYSKFFTVEIDAENAWAVRATPPHLSLKEKTDQVERRTGRFMLESIDKRTFRVLNVLDEEPRFINFDPKKDEPRNRYFLAYDFTNLACDELPPFLIIRTDHPRAELLDLRVRHDPCTKITPTMPMGDYRSSLGIVKPGESIEVPLEFKKPRRPRMSSVTCKDPRLTTTMVEQTNDGKELKVVTLVTISPDMPEGLFQIPITYSDGVIQSDHTLYGWVQK